VAGHLIKSRAQKNYIEYNRLTDETAGSPSYEIDLPNGGESYIIGNLIEKSTKSLNHSAMITYAEEGTSNPSQALYVVNNSAVNDSGYSTVAFVRASGSPTGSIINNIFAGPGIAVSGGSFTQSNNLVTYSDPGFVNKVDYDYCLKSTSMAIDAGTAPDVSSTGAILTPAYQYVHPLSSQVRSIAGTEVDQGAYEYGI